MAYYDVILNAGHISPEESIVLFHAASDRGVRRIVIDHPCDPIVDATLEQQEELGRMGAYLDHGFAKLLPMWQVSLEKVRDSIALVGAGRCLASTDCGFTARPYPADALRLYGAILKVMGLDQQKVRTITVDNPRTLLGL